MAGARLTNASPSGPGIAPPSCSPAVERIRLWWPAALVYAVAVLAQTWTLGKVMLPSVDEGVNLAAARLLLDGHVPYRDFFLSHPPTAFLGAAAVLATARFDVPRFSFLYVLWVFLAVFPVYRAVVTLTGRRLAGFWAAVLLVTWPDFARWDARFFAVRQASVPFFAFALDLVVRRRRLAVAGVLLGLFATCVATNVPIALLLVLGMAAAALVEEPPAWRAWLREHAALLGAFAAVSGLVLGVSLLIPRFYHCILGFQLERTRLTVWHRLLNLWVESLPENAVILVLGFLCAVPCFRMSRGVALVPAVGLPLAVFAYNYYSAHHLASLAPALAVTGGVAVAALLRSRATDVVVSAGLAALLCATTVPTLKSALVDTVSPNLFSVVRELERCPEPVFTAQPLYALHARRALTFHYFAADMRSHRVSSLPPLSDAEFADVVGRSGTVLLEPLMLSILTPDRFRLLARHFEIRFRDQHHGILVRRDRDGAPSGDALPGPVPAPGGGR